jgi:DNA invertase Pin-like site-specific DNA recombinase
MDQNNEVQIRELTEYVERRRWELAGVYQDQLSGAKASRPDLNRLMADARKREFDVVVVWKLDRFGRSLVNLVSGIQELSSLGVRFIAVSQGIDTDESNPAAKLLMHVLGAIAEFERALIQERVVAGMRSARANGKHCGRPRRVLDRSEVVRLRDEERLSWPQIAKKVGAGVGTVVRAYQGYSKAAQPFQNALREPSISPSAH